MPDTPAATARTSPAGSAAAGRVRRHRLLVAVVIGSGIAAQQLSPDDTGLQLLQSSITTVFGLGVLIPLVFQIIGAALGTALVVTLYPDVPRAADAVVVPHETRPAPATERTTR